MEEMKSRIFFVQADEENKLDFLGFTEDSNKMNWVSGKKKWGTVYCPAQIQPSVERWFEKSGNLREKYILKNISKFPIAFKRTDVGIYTTFNDNYADAEVCLNQKCHTHIFCGGEAAYVMALQMGGKSPNLGLKLLKGNILSYSVNRDLSEESNDRGDFILHPELSILEPGEQVEIEWELFPFKGKEDFFQKLLETPGFPVVRTQQCTWFSGETIKFQVQVHGEIAKEKIQIRCSEDDVPYTLVKNNQITTLCCSYKAKKSGELKVSIRIDNKQTHALFMCYSNLNDLVKNRCLFIANKQQYHRENSVLDGAYLIYDNDEEKLYYSHMDDHNGGRERIGMGVLIAKYLQKNPNLQLQKSLEQYVRYVYRELYDQETGIVYNDVERNLDWHRLYNYPWMAVFQLELYRLFKNKKYLKDSFQTMMRYYEEGGKEFYGIAIPAAELFNSLNGENMKSEAEIFRSDFIKHCERILQNGLQYPPFEVRYEQSIVAPAVDCLFQAYIITQDEKFKEEANRQLKVLELFNSEQPDYHQYEVAIRHWDGRWFGKYKRYGDTYPHYWSSLTGINYAHYEHLMCDKSYHAKASASFRGSLSLFSENGRASCAMVYPETINEAKGHYYDPWANDQDWALYFALKYENYTC